MSDGSINVEPADRYKLDMYRALLRKKRAEAVKGREAAHSALAATLAVTPERVALQELPLPTPATDTPDVVVAVNAAERQRPDLAALDKAIVAKTADVHATRAAQLPQFFVGGTFAYSYAPNRDIQLNPWAGDWFNTLAFGVALGVRQDLAFPLLHAQSKKASAELSTLERQRIALARLVRVQVEAAVADLRAAAERYEAG